MKSARVMRKIYFRGGFKGGGVNKTFIVKYIHNCDEETTLC